MVGYPPSGHTVGSPWAQTPAEDVFNHLETCLRLHRPDMVDRCVFDEEFDAEEVAECMSNTSLDGSKVQDPMSSVEIACGPLHTDGDWICRIQGTVDQRVRSTVKVVKVECHATDAVVAGGRVQGRDWGDSDGANEAADFGRRRQLEHRRSARRRLQTVFRLPPFATCIGCSLRWLEQLSTMLAKEVQLRASQPGAW